MQMMFQKKELHFLYFIFLFCSLLLSMNKKIEHQIATEFLSDLHYGQTAFAVIIIIKNEYIWTKFLGYILYTLRT